MLLIAIRKTFFLSLCLCVCLICNLLPIVLAEFCSNCCVCVRGHFCLTGNNPPLTVAGAAQITAGRKVQFSFFFFFSNRRLHVLLLACESRSRKWCRFRGRKWREGRSHASPRHTYSTDESIEGRLGTRDGKN